MVRMLIVTTCVLLWLIYAGSYIAPFDTDPSFVDPRVIYRNGFLRLIRPDELLLMEPTLGNTFSMTGVIVDGKLTTAPLVLAPRPKWKIEIADFSLAVHESKWHADLFRKTTMIVPCIYPAVGMTVAALLLVGVPCVRKRRRISRGLCANCGYSLRGAVTDVCSECGAPIPCIQPAGA